MVQFTGCTSVQKPANAIHSVFLLLESGTENRLLYLCGLYEILVTVNLNMCWDDRLSGKAKLIAAAENANGSFPLWGMLVCFRYCIPHVHKSSNRGNSCSFSKTCCQFAAVTFRGKILKWMGWDGMGWKDVQYSIIYLHFIIQLLKKFFLFISRRKSGCRCGTIIKLKDTVELRFVLGTSQLYIHSSMMRTARFGGHH